ncbi:hypothetical protein AAVH_21878 [Aphelenchoides avenae]|nr:hypothetical protein AAVH_21878 [Aphelenchus avenae]
MADLNQYDAGLVIGDGYFGNLRPFRHYSERICFVSSMLSNALLAVLLIREKNETMKPYSRVLLINVVVDYVYTITCMVVEMEMEMNGGVYLYVINGIPTNWSRTWQKAAIAAWIFACASATLVPVIEFTFRYFLVVKHYLLGIWQLLGLAAIASICAFIDAMFFFFAMGSEEDHVAAFGHLMASPIWTSEGRKVVYYGADKVFSVVSVAAIPIGVIMTLLFLNARYVGFGNLIALVLQWIPAVNPITTIFLVGPYREKVFGKLWPSFARRSAVGDMSRTNLSFATSLVVGVGEQSQPTE